MSSGVPEQPITEGVFRCDRSTPPAVSIKGRVMPVSTMVPGATALRSMPAPPLAGVTDLRRTQRASAALVVAYALKEERSARRQASVSSSSRQASVTASSQGERADRDEITRKRGLS